MRIHRRYLVLDVVGPLEKVTVPDILEAVKDSCADNWGDLGIAWAVMAFKVVHFCAHGKSFVLRTPTDMVDVIMSSLVFIPDVLGCPMTLAVTQVCGSWKMAKLAYVKLLRRSLDDGQMKFIQNELAQVQE
eukprot:GEMP01130148.1.p1 GENE.GEMP01130148.1~~GEMP01130148.1.p1  ORF type:complete len:131 (+),score=21.03 GEMP01130148.1:75-467(+)